MQYAIRTLIHKWFVLLASFRVGLPLWRALVHDLSKFTSAELPHYNRHFFGDKCDPRGFAIAWLHHQNCNPHHWEYWITRSDHTKGAGGTVEGILPMPTIYIKEMIVDWVAASRTYTGSWDISKWLTEHLSLMKLHPYTLDIIKTELSALGYHYKFDRFANVFRVSNEPVVTQARAIRD